MDGGKGFTSTISPILSHYEWWELQKDERSWERIGTTITMEMIASNSRARKGGKVKEVYGGI